MSIEELKKQSDEDEIYFLDILTVYKTALDRSTKAELDLVRAKNEAFAASLDYNLALAAYSKALGPFLETRRAYVAARSK